MNSIFFTVITLLLLTAGVLLLMQEFNKTKVSKDTSEPPQPELMTKEEGEDHFSVLMNSVTPVWYYPSDVATPKTVPITAKISTAWPTGPYMRSPIMG